MAKSSNTLTVEARKFDQGWVSISQSFAYAHPVNDRIYKINIQGAGDTEEAALADGKAKVDYFMADRGDTIVKVGNFVWAESDDDGLADVQEHQHEERPQP